MKKTIMFSVLVSVLVIASIAMVSAIKPVDTNPNPEFGFVANGTSCADTPQKNSMQYNAGNGVWMKAINLNSSETYAWEIYDWKSDGASKVLVASNTITGETSVCFNAYNSTTNDSGLFKLDIDGKNAGEVHINAMTTPQVPEFGTTVGILTALGAVGTFFVVRRK